MPFPRPPLYTGIRALRPTVLRNPRALCFVCAQRTKFSKPDIHVFLREDIPGIGEKGEIALANLAQARNYLVPFGLAYYVPRVKGKPILPEGWEPRIREDDVVLETIVPAFSSVRVERRQTQTETGFATTAKPNRGERLTLDSEKHAALQLVPQLTFERVRMRADSDRIYGSVTPEDIVLDLLNKHGIVLEKEAVRLEARIKEIGSHSVQVAIGELPSVELQIVVADSA
ncbi:hypothetical protein BDZ88DRAFT_455514 [Geranomyces variabilis]|nr:hypothetical protein BDZ88DRAFT_455514 [Geranomyces variabilis]KAJ3142462.1 hypothetical protein HDU90_004736 [Geranomyces variabilis]